jgi:insulin receptor
MKLGLRSAELDAFEVPQDHITILHELGRGNFSHVMKAQVLDMQSRTPRFVAAKFATSDGTQSDRQMLFNEARQMSQFKHGNVVRLVGVCFKSVPSCILLELLPNGDLRSYLKQCEAGGTVLSGQHFARLVADCCGGFEYLASIKFVHRDLAARNVVLGSGFEAKIGDFGEDLCRLVGLYPH